MTSPREKDRRDLDAPLDAMLRALTDIDDRALASRARTMTALGSRDVARVRVRQPGWRIPAAFAAAALVTIGLVWALGRPQPAATGPPASSTTARPAASAPVATVPSSPPIAASVPDIATHHVGPPEPVPASARLRSQRPATSRSPRPTPRRDTRLAEVIAAVRQLPPEVWERAEAPVPAAAPIDVPELVVAPLEIAPMPDAAQDAPAEVNPGAPR